MHQPNSAFDRLRPRHANQCGVALVLVLAMLVLVTGLIIAYLQTVRTDLSSSSTYEKSTSSRLLAETALNLVIGQIQEATQRPGEAWVSQPGLIRTFDTSGSAASAYKLYSNDVMRVIGAFDPAAGGDLPPGGAADIKNKPNEWADLNEPVKTTQFDSDGNPVEHFLYPIIDPRAIGEVEGFDSPTEDLKNADGSQAKYADGSDAKEIPMPVKWLYLLKDGTVTPGVASGTVSTVTIAGKNAANPAVARMAFWTDDESSKVNINTAGEGTFWDTPVGNTYPSALIGKTIGSQSTRDSGWGADLFESDLAYFLGAQNEFQRYPGHPATTSLSTVLGGPLSAALGTTDPVAIGEKILEIVPRYAGGDNSSKGGTSRPATNSVLSPGQDRLYASLDELLYSPALSASLQRDRSWDDAAAAKKADRVLEETKFFLTASSKSPEVNLQNKPRVVAWPVHTDETRRTAFDRLIKFCGEIGTGKKNFVFTRTDPTSATVDWNAGNQAIYAYLQSLTGLAIPGFGGALLNKYGTSERDQILTQIFDYIRCLNLQDTSLGDPAKSYTKYDDDRTRGQVVPINPGNGTRGFGRFPTISEVTIFIVGRGPTNTEIPSQGARTAFMKTTSRIQLAVVLEPFCPMAGFSALAPNFKVVYDELNLLVENASPAVGFPPTPITLHANGLPTNANNENLSRTGGTLGPGYLSIGNVTGPADRIIPVSNWVDVPGSNATNGIGYPDNKLTIKAGSTIAFHIESQNGDLIQNFRIPISRDIVVPIPSPDGTSANLMTSRLGGLTGSNVQGGVKALKDTLVSFLPTRFPSGAPSNTDPNTADVQCDFRLVQIADEAGRFFNVLTAAEDPAYYRTSDASNPNTAVHNLRNFIFKRYSGFAAGELVAGLNQYDLPIHGSSVGGSWIRGPEIPPGIKGVVNYKGQPGDWDNGPGLHSDGAYFNKADEGSSQGDPRESGNSRQSPYLQQWDRANAVLDATFFSPNRQMPSPAMFGSLPTGVKRDRPWQTLLFRPARSYLPGGTGHPGAESGVPEHLWLDLFWMPVVEPYAISEPFSTAGKININHQIAPFNFIRRDTGLRAVFKAVKLTALDSTQDTANNPPTQRFLINRYKMGGTSSTVSNSGMPDVSVRFDIDAEKTIWAMDKFVTDKGRPFISASEICEIPLIPKDPAFASISDVSGLDSALSDFWSNKKLTGDNSLERPYAHIYPRLTTKSNTYTVHVRVQRLVATPVSAEAGEFNSARDKVTGEFRGSFVIERYLDPNSDSLVKDDGSGNLIPVSNENDPDAFLGPYKFRVVSSKQLAQ